MRIDPPEAMVVIRAGHRVGAALGGGVVALAVGCSGVDTTWVEAPRELPAAQAVAPPCHPTPIGPVWLAEGEPLSLTFSCGSGVALSKRAVGFSGLPAGASYDVGASVLTWTPALDQAALYPIQLELPESGERQSFAIGVADAHDHPDNIPVVDPSRYPEEYGVPVFFLDPGPTESVYHDATITYRGRPFTVQAKLRGQSSLDYPKRSYTLKFDNDDLFDALDLGFSSRKKIVLTSTFDDNTYVRQRLTFDLWNAMDPGHLQIQTGHAVVYVNGQYHGLYLLSDHVDRHLLRAHGLLDTGNLYKARSYAADFRVQEPLHAGIWKKEGKPEDDYTDLGRLITFVDTANDAAFRTGIGEILDVRDYQDWWVLVTIIRADDSANKNSYHYMERPGAPARYAPWDFNAAFGQSWATFRQPPQGVRTYEGQNRIFERLLRDPELGSEMKNRRNAALAGVFHPDNVDALIDRYLAEIEPAALRDFQKWQAHYEDFSRWKRRQDFTSVEAEVAYVRSWYRAHWLTLVNGAGEVAIAEPGRGSSGSGSSGSGSSGSSPGRSGN